VELTRDVGRAAALLRAGAVLAYPTETFYGLGALWSNAPALERLAAAKLRPPGKPVPLLAADREMLGAVVAHLDRLALRLADRFWPGPLTLVLPAAAGLPAGIAPEGKVGIRIPASAAARELSRLAGGPLTSTSANLSGAPPPTRAEDLSPEILRGIDAVLDGGPTPGGLPSTVVDLCGPGAPSLLRVGAVPWERILEEIRSVPGIDGLPRTGE
jgi:L-threonylcarbamoyladenylate synthase